MLKNFVFSHFFHAIWAKPDKLLVGNRYLRPVKGRIPTNVTRSGAGKPHRLHYNRLALASRMRRGRGRVVRTLRPLFLLKQKRHY